MAIVLSKKDLYTSNIIGVKIEKQKRSYNQTIGDVPKVKEIRRTRYWKFAGCVVLLTKAIELILSHVVAGALKTSGTTDKWEWILQLAWISWQRRKMWRKLKIDMGICNKKALSNDKAFFRKFNYLELFFHEFTFRDNFRIRHDFIVINTWAQFGYIYMILYTSHHII